VSSTYDPTPFQARVETIPESFCLFLGGGRGGGKTHSAIRLILGHCERYREGARVLVTRKEQISLGQFRDEMRRMTTARFNAQDSTFHFDNGATCSLRHCESEAALVSVAQGFSFSLIAVDEAGDAPTLSVIDQLMLSLRSASGVPTRMLLLANPAGRNHADLAARHVTSHVPWAPYTLGAREWVTCPSTLDDNPHWGDEYRRNFEQTKLSDPNRYLAMRYGDWSAIVGAYFARIWDAGLMTVPVEELRPDYFNQLRWGADWGTNSPCAFVLGGRLAQDVELASGRLLPRGAVVLTDEHSEHDPNDIKRGTGRAPSQIAPALWAISRRWRVTPKGVIDSAANARTQYHGQQTISSLFRQHSVQFSSARKLGTRADRFENLRQMMVEGMLYVSTACRIWLATVPSLPIDERDPSVPDTRANDHFADATLYLLEHLLTGQVSSGRWSDGNVFGTGRRFVEPPTITEIPR
jgi:hypothetical protein